ncbi:MAG: MMPL family transporter [Myxococcota bacterium]
MSASPVRPNADRSQYGRQATWAIAFFVALALGAALYGAGVKPLLKAGGIIALHSDSAEAKKWLHDGLGVSSPDVIAIFTSDSLSALDTDYYDEIEPVLEALAEDETVESVSSYFDSGLISMVSEDERSTVVFIALRGDDSDKARALPKLHETLSAAPMTVRLGGPLAAEAFAQETAFKDLARGELIAAPIIVLLLFYFFRGITATLLPVAIAAFAIPTTLAGLRVLTHFMDVSVFALNVASIVGIGLSVDYALLVVTRFREEISHGLEVDAALERTRKTAGLAILVSGCTVAVSLAALIVFPIMVLRSIAVSGIMVVGFAMLGALVLLPALLARFGHRVVAKQAHVVSPMARQLRIFAHWVMRWPVALTIVTTAFLLTLGTPALRMKSAMPDSKIFTPGAEVRVVDEILEDRQTGFGKQPLTPIFVAARSKTDFAAPGELEKLIAFVKRLKAVPGVERVESPFASGELSHPDDASRRVADPSSLSDEEQDFLKDTLRGDLALVYVYAEAPWRSNEAGELVGRLRGIDPSDLTVRIGGPTAENYDGRRTLEAYLPTVFWIIVATNIAILFLAFGSVVIPFKAIAMNVVSVAASFGALVWIFQDGHLRGLLHFETQSGIEVTVPVVLLAVVFGLSMDYEIFMLSRIKEEFDKSGDNTASVAIGLEHTSSIITRAALLLIAVVGAFAFGEFIFVKEIGVGLVVAIFLDATIVRCVLVPSTMKLLGRFNWWSPAWLRRIWNPSFKDL